VYKCKIHTFVPRLSLSEGLKIVSVGKPEVRISFMRLGSRWLANVETGPDKCGMGTELDRLESTAKF